MDKQFGLTEYVGEACLSEVPCILKRLYSDFIVVEIPKLNACLQHVTTNELCVKRPLIEENDSEPNTKRLKCDNSENVELTTEVEQNQIKLDDVLTEGELANIDSIHSEKLESFSIIVKDWDKVKRKAVHEFLRQKYGRHLMANSKDGVMEIRRAGKFAKDARDRGGIKADDDEGQCPKGHCLYFTMTKENKDTSNALSVIAKLSGLRPSMFSVAGTKDRRAITTQLVAVAKVSKAKLRRIQSKLRGIWIENLHYSPLKLQLGTLWGNHFEIVLRDLNLVEVDRKELCRRIENWKRNGFLNYFGHQRFGSCGTNTADVGRFILSGQWESAVRTILAPRDDAHGNLAACLAKFHETSDAKLALEELNKKLNSRRQLFFSIEENVLHSLKANPKDFKGAVLKLARDVRSLYIHAYQSFVFNKIVSQRIQKFGLKVIEGDLNLEGVPIQDISSAQLSDIALPLPSLNDNLLNNEVGQWYKDITDSDQITKESFGELERNFVIGDVYRPMLVKPLNVSWEVVAYTDDRQILQSSLFTTTCDMASSGVTIGSEQKAQFALKIKFDLPACSYATVALREILRTDLSKFVQKSREEVFGGSSSIIRVSENFYNSFGFFK